MTTKSSRSTVLVIDDDPYLRELVETIGRNCGVKVLQAPDCAAGLKILNTENHKIKMVLLDYFMPGVQPVQCADAILEIAGSSIPVILMTAAPDPSTRAAELKLHRWIAKPFEASTMTRLMTEKTPLKKARKVS